MVDHVVMFSGGVGSWAAATRFAAAHGTDHLILLFADTRTEDEDLYRFLPEAAANVGAELVRVADGRNVWELASAHRSLPSSRMAFCSRELKQRPSRRWVREHFGPADVVLYLGIDWTEIHRLAGAQRGWAPYTVEAPLCEKPYLSKSLMCDQLRAEGIRPPRLYEMGFPHNNCGGFCVRAGQSQFARLFEVMPERYARHEAEEEKIRQQIGKDVSILLDRRNGESHPLTLRDLRERIQAGDAPTLWDWSGCGCFVDEEPV